MLWLSPVFFPLQGIHNPHTCARHQGEKDEDSKSHFWPNQSPSMGADWRYAFRFGPSGCSEKSQQKTHWDIPKLPPAAWPWAGEGPWCVVCGWHLKSWSRNWGAKSIFCFRPPQISQLCTLAVIKRELKSVSAYWFQAPQAAPWWRLMMLQFWHKKGNEFLYFLF